MSMSTPHFRAATAHDLETVAALLRAAKLPTDGLDEQFGPAFVLAVCDDDVVGAAGIECYGDAGLLRSAVVADTWQGQGLGAALTRDRLEWARQSGLRELWLLTTTADVWFARFGFERVDRMSAPPLLQASREFREACPASAIAMRLHLTSGSNS
jgi:amino-acid N-acetyltransferase